MPLAAQFFITILSLYVSILGAQELPPIQIYNPQTYQGATQNWAISQADNRFIYVANNSGLLEYDGSNWNLYKSPNEAILRSVKVIDNDIYTGSYMDFGYWRKNEFGKLTYKSLVPKLKQPLIEDEQVWKILNVDTWVLFQTLNRIYIYDTLKEDFKIIDSNIAITKMYQIDKDIYFQRSGEGIFKFDNGQDVLVSNNEIFKNGNVINLFDSGDGLMVLTANKGFFVLSGTRLKSWDKPANEFIKKLNVYCSESLDDGSYVLGTISDGLIHLNENGELLNALDQSHGLSNNTVLSIFQDEASNIWLGLDNGINCINYNSAYKIYNDNIGEIGTVYASKVYNGNLYLGTNQGLYVKGLNEKGDFNAIENTAGQVWCLVEIDGELLCGHNNGTYLIKDESALLLSDIDGTWDIQPIPNTNFLLQGNYNGLNILEKKNGWQFRNKIAGFDNSSRYFAFLNDSIVFVGHEYKGVYKIIVDKDYKTARSVISEPTVEKGLNASLTKFKDRIIYGLKDGVFYYDLEKDRFVKDSLLSKIYTDTTYTSGKLIPIPEKDIIWGFSENSICYVTKGKFSKELQIHRLDLSQSLRRGMIGFENVEYIGDDQYLFGSSSGYTILNLDKLVDRDYIIYINEISKQKVGGVLDKVNIYEEGTFSSKENNISFKFSVPEFNKFLEPEFQYKLEGYYHNWSRWNKESMTSFKNLPAGSYTFMVRAKVGEKISENVGIYVFSVLTPWYLSTPAWFSYVVAFLIIAFLINRFYRKFYAKKQRQALLATKRELELKKLENEQQRMHFKNEKLQNDIEGKNRELAISTMSIIKKNEFLNSIKAELLKSKSEKELKSIVKTIDKNLNSNDDWQFFEEAFNNADKDFLNKIKTRHPNLTPNDLKLCAYLRLNLSSKEIAPLLNISPKSVEVKRYRLRKKMDLPHEANITDYILQI